jgi:branched chain amino acid efflux pump
VTLVHSSPPPAPTAGSTGRSFLEGTRDILPMTLSVVPFAFAIGAAIAHSDVAGWAGWTGAPLILAGSAQLSAVEMLDRGAAPLVIVASALFINARILLYGAGLAPWFREEGLGRRMLLALPVIDQLYFVCVPRFEQGDLDRRGRQAYYAGAAVTLATAWVAAQALAVGVGAQLPEGAGLGLAAPLALAGLLAKATADRPALLAAAVGGIVAVAAVGVPFRSAVLIGAVTGTLAGSLSGSLTGRRVEEPVP